MTYHENNCDEDLNHEYMVVYQDMLRYLSSKDISMLVAKDIRDDILAIALESQERGLRVEEAFGDYQRFCDGICENAVQETRMEKLLRCWKLVSSIIAVWMVLDLIGFGMDETKYIENGILTLSWKSLALYTVMLLGYTVLVRWHNRQSFHHILGAWYTYAIAFGVLCLIFLSPLHILTSYFHVSIGTVSIPLWVIILLIISCVFSWIALHMLQKKQFREYKGMSKGAQEDA